MARDAAAPGSRGQEFGKMAGKLIFDSKGISNYSNKSNDTQYLIAILFNFVISITGDRCVLSLRGPNPPTPSYAGDKILN